MKKTEQEYSNALKRSIYEFYISNREFCLQQYVKTEDEKLSAIYETTEDEKEIVTIYTRISTIILTANKYEKNVLHANWNNESKEKIQRIPIQLFPQRESSITTYAYYFCFHGQDILHIESMVTGSYTIGGSADIVRYIINNPYLYPSVIISFGVCFGIDETEQTLGDTIISEKVYPYFIGSKFNENNYIVSDNNMFQTNNNLYSKIKSEIFDLNSLKKFEFKTYFGNYITGEAVISNKTMRDQFANITTQEIHAGDMEGYGLFKECCGNNYIIPCIIIKSICDWAVLKNLYDPSLFHEICIRNNIHNYDDKEIKTIKDRLQSYAAFNAYRVLKTIFEQQILEFPLYKELESKILENPYEKVIHIERIEKILKSLIKNRTYIFNRRLTSNITLNYCRILIKEGVLSKLNDEKVYIDTAWNINRR